MKVKEEEAMSIFCFFVDEGFLRVIDDQEVMCVCVCVCVQRSVHFPTLRKECVACYQVRSNTKSSILTSQSGQLGSKPDQRQDRSTTWGR